MPLYYCDHCDYDAKGLKANFTKHCNSNKHKNLLLLASKMLIPICICISSSLYIKPTL